MRFLSPAHRRTLLVLLALLLVVPLAAQLAVAQSSPPIRKAPPPPPPPPATDQEQFVAYWTTETGWKSELQLRNNMLNQELAVTPFLRRYDGTETPLPSVSLKPQEIRIVDLESAVIGVAPNFIGTYGSVVLRYHSSGFRNLYATLMIHNIGHSIAFHIDGTGEVPNQQPGSREGIWWLPNETATDYLVLTNQGSSALQVDLSVYDPSGREAKQKIAVPPRATNRLSARQLVASTGLSGTFGGIKVYTPTHAGSLDSVHLVFDEKASFSAMLKMFDYDPRTTLQERDHAGTKVWTLRAPMLALSHPDPALAFPEGTVLQPQLFVRNAFAKPVDVNVRFNWRSAATSGRSPGPSLRLGPYETRRIDVASLQAANAIPKDASWASVILTTNGLPDEVMALAASYDETLRFGAQTPFSDQLSFHYAGSMWEYDPQHDSLITVGNGGTKPLKAALTITYNEGAQKYELEQALQPDEQMWIDVGKLIREQVRDKNGGVLPANLTSGSYELRDLTNKGAGQLFEGKIIYDRTYGHVTYGCGGCCGYTQTKVTFNPLGIPFTSTAGNGVEGYDTCYSNWSDVSDSFYGNWTTANTSIATVNYYATHTGVAVGATTSNTFGYLDGASLRLCPYNRHTPSGGANVNPVITSISPAQGLIGNTLNVTISGKGFGTNPTVVTVQGITATVQSASDTQITASFAISATSPVTGNSNVYVQNHATSLNSNSVNFYIQVPTYFFSPTAVQTAEPAACSLETGYFINVSYYVAAQDSSRVSQSGMAPGENVGGGWNDAYATPATTNSDGSFNDTPVGACYGTSGHYCEAGVSQSFRLTNNGQVFSIMTNTTRRTCTDGIQLVIQGNPAAQNKTYTFGNTQ